jgi:hypothetical protein
MRDVESPVQRLNTHMATLGKISMDKGVGTDNAESDFSGKWSNWPCRRTVSNNHPSQSIAIGVGGSRLMEAAHVHERYQPE